MYIDDLRIYAFDKNEKDILYNNPNIVNGNIKLSSKDIKVYFYLKDEGEMGLTDLVRKCLIKEGYDLNSPKLYKARKKPNSEEFYETGSFWGCDEFRVDTFSRSMNKLLKVGLVDKRKTESCVVFKSIV